MNEAEAKSHPLRGRKRDCDGKFVAVWEKQLTPPYGDGNLSTIIIVAAISKQLTPLTGTETANLFFLIHTSMKQLTPLRGRHNSFPDVLEIVPICIPEWGRKLNDSLRSVNHLIRFFLKINLPPQGTETRTRFPFSLWTVQKQLTPPTGTETAFDHGNHR